MRIQVRSPLILPNLLPPFLWQPFVSIREAVSVQPVVGHLHVSARYDRRRGAVAGAVRERTAAQRCAEPIDEP